MWKGLKQLLWRKLPQDRIVMMIDASRSEGFSDAPRRTRGKIPRTNLREKTVQIR